MLLQVYVGDILCGKVQYEVGKDIYEIACGDAVGRSVKIVQDIAPYLLSLCEVQTFGKNPFENYNIAFIEKTKKLE